MAGFKGQAEYSVDNKGRVTIPAKMRSYIRPEANNKITMTRGLDKCIYLYPHDVWQNKETEISELNTYNRESRQFIRLIMMWAEDQELDGQGRVMLSKELMEFAGIKDRARIIGAFDHIELWDPEIFDGYLNEESEEYETLAERVMVM